ncbi:Wax ester synthase/diacylglycerol acyltransferase 5 [Linum perenne]
MKCKTSREPLPPESSNSDEPLTPAGRLFLRPELDIIIHGAFGLKDSLDVEAIKEVARNSLMSKHPRFCSLLVRDKRGRERWRRTDVEIDRHIIVVDRMIRSGDEEDSVNDYIADLSVSSPLGQDKPLWEIHLLTAERCIVFRIHHALGDGISLMSMLLADCRTISDPDAPVALPTAGKSGGKRRRRSVVEAAGDVLMMVFYSLVFCLEFVMRTLWIGDRRTVFSGGAGVELWARKLATARFSIEDMRTVKATVAYATINDVLFGVVTSGLSKYLDHRSPNDVKKGQQITGVAMVNLRKQPGLQVASMCNYRIISNTTFTISNVVGPKEEITMAGNPITFIRVNTSSLPHALTMHMLSYAGRADMQILVAKDIIPDPEFLAKCFEDSLLEMKTAAQKAASLSSR